MWVLKSNYIAKAIIFDADFTVVLLMKNNQHKYQIQHYLYSTLH